LREAVAELQQYLSDRVPPLMVVDSFSLLVQQPPQFLAAEIGAWLAYQRPAGADLSVADLLFHGAKKIALMGELDLVPKPDIARCLGGVTEALLPQCPEEDRELLRQNFDRLRNASLAGTAADPIPVLDRQPGAEAARSARAAQAPSVTLSPEATRGLRRLSLFLEHLQAPVAGDGRRRPTRFPSSSGTGGLAVHDRAAVSPPRRRSWRGTCSAAPVRGGPPMDQVL
jgi:hypothetical protein